MGSGYAGLDPCVHCGFCLPACPTYLTTGDENESPRGRIVLMRALEHGEVAVTDPHLRLHLENCLGCLGCEPACPSGVAYGGALHEARLALHAAGAGAGAGAGSPLRWAFLATFADRHLWRPFLAAARWFRRTSLPRRLAGGSRLGFTMGMLASTAGLPASVGPRAAGGTARRESPEPEPEGPTVAIFGGCVMDTLFPHVHDATARTLRANGFRVVRSAELECCGALHAHAGDAAEARALAAKNVATIPRDIDYLVVDSGGCGALLKDYGSLLGTPEGRAFGERVRDVTELLAEAGPRAGGALELRVAYDAPCHLHHAQRVVDAPRAVLDAIPGLQVVLPPGYDRCCGSAGLYSMERPALARAILDDKLEAVLEDAAPLDAVATGNPGCLMHIGAGLLARGRSIPVVHPVELLDRSYEIAGLYRAPPPS